MDELKTFSLGRGSHKTREDGMCLLESVAYLAGEPHSDRPECVSPYLASFARILNDSVEDDLRQELLGAMPWRLIGTNVDSLEEAREQMSDYLVEDQQRRGLLYGYRIVPGNLETVCREQAALLDRMIRLSEPQEVVPQGKAEAIS